MYLFYQPGQWDKEKYASTRSNNLMGWDCQSKEIGFKKSIKGGINASPQDYNPQELWANCASTIVSFLEAKEETVIVYNRKQSAASLLLGLLRLSANEDIQAEWINSIHDGTCQRDKQWWRLPNVQRQICPKVQELQQRMLRPIWD